MLVFGAGTGAEVLGALAAGCNVTAIESDPAQFPYLIQRLQMEAGTSFQQKARRRSAGATCFRPRWRGQLGSPPPSSTTSTSLGSMIPLPRWPPWLCQNSRSHLDPVDRRLVRNLLQILLLRQLPRSWSSRPQTSARRAVRTWEATEPSAKFAGADSVKTAPVVQQTTLVEPRLQLIKTTLLFPPVDIIILCQCSVNCLLIL